MTWKKKIELFKKFGLMHTAKAIRDEPKHIAKFEGHSMLLDGLIYDFNHMLVDCRVEQKPGIHKCLEHLLVIKREHFKEDQS